MKKLLALLLVLFLPVCAAAETYKVSIEFDVDAKLLETFIVENAALDGASGDQLSTVIQIIQRIVDGAKVEIAVQDDAVSIDTFVGSGRLLDMTIHAKDSATYLTSSMLADSALVIESDEDEEFEQSVDDIDWNAAEAAVESALTDWLSHIVPTEARGTFIGDAYDGGTQCTTWVISDKDIADLLSAVMSNEMRQIASLHLKSMGYDAAELLSKFDAKNELVATENAYDYIIRLVRNDAGDMVGISLTVVHEAAQIATFSLGLQEGKNDFVVGLGGSGQNYWGASTAYFDSFQDTTSITVVSREWLADKEYSFAYVREKETPVQETTWYCNVKKKDGNYRWDAAVSDLYALSSNQPRITTIGHFMPSTSAFHSSIDIMMGTERMFTMNMNLAPVEEIPALDEDLELYFLTDPAMSEACENLLEQFSATFAARMIKLLPMDLLFKLNAPSLP